MRIIAGIRAFKVVLYGEDDNAGGTGQGQTADIDGEKGGRAEVPACSYPDAQQYHIVAGHVPVFRTILPIAGLITLHDGLYGSTQVLQLGDEYMHEEFDRAQGPVEAWVEDKIQKCANRGHQDIASIKIHLLLGGRELFELIDGERGQRAAILAPVAIGGMVVVVVPGPDKPRQSDEHTGDETEDPVQGLGAKQTLVAAIMHQHEDTYDKQGQDEDIGRGQPVGDRQTLHRQVEQAEEGDEGIQDLNKRLGVTALAIFCDYRRCFVLYTFS